MPYFSEIGESPDAQDELPCILPLNMDLDTKVFITRSDFVDIAKAFGYSIGLIPELRP